MPNQQLIDYIKKNKEKFSVNDLKKALIQQGFSKIDVDQAAEIATGKTPPLLNQSTAPSPKLSSSEGLDPDTAKILAALSYPIWIIAIITIMMAKPKDKFARYHGFQALFFGIGIIIIYIALWIIQITIGNIPIFGFLVIIIGLIVSMFFWLAVLILGIVFAVKAYKGDIFKIPLIYKFIPSNAKYE